MGIKCFRMSALHITSLCVPMVCISLLPTPRRKQMYRDDDRPQLPFQSLPFPELSKEVPTSDNFTERGCVSRSKMFRVLTYLRWLCPKPDTLSTILPSTGQNQCYGNILLPETSVFIVKMADHDGNHRCIVEKNVPIASHSIDFA